MNRLPVWLLDVDGTLCAPQPTGWGDVPRTGTLLAGVHPRERKLVWSPRLVREVARIASSGLVEVRWCTTWGPWTSSLEKLLGLPHLGNVITLPTTPLATGTAKLAAADDVTRSGRHLVWTDDDIPFEGPLYDRIVRAGSVLVAPDPLHGLQPEHIQAIWASLKASQVSAPDDPTITFEAYERRA